MNPPPDDATGAPAGMTTQPAAPVTATRQEALARVAEYLRDAGYRGLDRSWRADDGVIDIVAQQGTSSSRAS